MTKPTNKPFWVTNSLQQLATDLPAPYRIEIDTATDHHWQVLDTFDQELSLRGQLLMQYQHMLVLLGKDALAIEASAPAKWSFGHELPHSRLTELLGELNPLRACLPVTKIQAELIQARLLDDERKTVCRLNLLQFDPSHSTNQCAIEIQPVKGYQRAAQILHELFKHFASSAEELEQLFNACSTNQPRYEKKPAIVFLPNDTVYQVATRLIAAYIPVARINEPGVIADWDTEFLHDYRISLRKVRSVLSLFKGIYSEPVTVDLKQRFACMMKKTNRLRDLDVYLLERENYRQLIPESMQDGLDNLFLDLAKKRKTEHDKVKRFFQSAPYQKEADQLESLFTQTDESKRRLAAGDKADTPVIRYALDVVRKHHKKIRKMAVHINDQTPDESVHKLRIQIKKLRYLIEFYGPMFPPKTYKQLLKAIRRLQNNLGRFNDYSVQQASLVALIEQQKKCKQPDIDVVQSIGAMVAALNRKQLEERALIVENLAHFTADKTQDLFTLLFAQMQELMRGESGV